MPTAGGLGDPGLQEVLIARSPTAPGGSRRPTGSSEEQEALLGPSSSQKPQLYRRPAPSSFLMGRDSNERDRSPPRDDIGALTHCRLGSGCWALLAAAHTCMCTQGCCQPCPGLLGLR